MAKCDQITDIWNETQAIRFPPFAIDWRTELWKMNRTRTVKMKRNGAIEKKIEKLKTNRQNTNS